MKTVVVAAIWKEFCPQWKLYDPSYGAAAYDSDNPAVKNPVDVLRYEKVAVKDFIGENLDDLTQVNLPAGATPSEPPHLQGKVLWHP